jgi:hypothetical protein
MRNMRYLYLLAALCVPAAQATTIFNTVPGALNNNSNPVNAEADFTFGPGGTLTLVLTNHQTDTSAVNQNISDIFFTLGDAGITGGTVDTMTGTRRIVNSNGTFSDTAYSGASLWTLSYGSGQFHLDSLVQGNDGTIIGPPNGSSFTNANGSITSGQHQFFADTLTFTLTIPNANANTTVTAATFSFGTAAGNNVPGDPCIAGCGGGQQDVPEPTSYLLVGGGLGLVGLLRRRFAA